LQSIKQKKVIASYETTYCTQINWNSALLAARSNRMVDKSLVARSITRQAFQVLTSDFL